jgi:hypothetical protein
MAHVQRRDGIISRRSGLWEMTYFHQNSLIPQFGGEIAGLAHSGGKASAKTQSVPVPRLFHHQARIRHRNEGMADVQ